MLRPDIPFARDDANRFLPWMIALMAALAALMLCVGLALDRWIAEQHGGFGNRLSVQIPDHPGHQQSLVHQASDVLAATPGVENVHVLSNEDVGKLVQPWLGDPAALSDLPLPTVIEVSVASPPPGKTPDYTELARKLQAISQDATLDTRAVWVEKFSRFSRLTEGVIYALAGAILAALAGMMVFAARAAMKLHADAVLLLHSLGAEDAYIAQQFQRNARALALRGSLPGTLIAAFIYFALASYAVSQGAPLLPRFTFTPAHVTMLAALPLACCALAVRAVRAATLSYLRNML